jgi:hypothetical protein
MKYFVAENTGKGFITHEDNQLSHISGFPGNVWYTGDINATWAARVGAVEKTKEEAQALVDAAIAGQTYPENEPGGPQNPNAGQQIVITLP